MWIGRLKIKSIWKFPNGDEIYVTTHKYIKCPCGCKILVLLNVGFIWATKQCFYEAKKQKK